MSSTTIERYSDWLNETLHSPPFNCETHFDSGFIKMSRNLFLVMAVLTLLFRPSTYGGYSMYIPMYLLLAFVSFFTDCDCCCLVVRTAGGCGSFALIIFDSLLYAPMWLHNPRAASSLMLLHLFNLALAWIGVHHVNSVVYVAMVVMQCMEIAVVSWMQWFTALTVAYYYGQPAKYDLSVCRKKKKSIESKYA